MAELVGSTDVCAIAAPLSLTIGCEAVAAVVVTARTLSATPVVVIAAATAMRAALAPAVMVVEIVDAAWARAGGADAVVAPVRGPQALRSSPAPRKAGHRRLS